MICNLKKSRRRVEVLMPTILLIRHGQSQSNAGEPTKCSESVELTENGQAQAREVANYFRQALLVPDIIVTSPHIRTKQTALPLKDFLSTPEFSLPFEDIWPVHEFTYLACWRKEFSTSADRQETVKAYWQIADPTYIDSSGSESFEQFIHRVRAFKARLESTEPSTVAVFSHEQFISAFLWLLQRGEVTPTSEEMRDYRDYLLANPIPNGGIVKAKFRTSNGEWTFERITEHLGRLADV
jgi:probable phosphoglycerate mutase